MIITVHPENIVSPRRVPLSGSRIVRRMTAYRRGDHQPDQFRDIYSTITGTLAGKTLFIRWRARYQQGQYSGGRLHIVFGEGALSTKYFSRRWVWGYRCTPSARVASGRPAAPASPPRTRRIRTRSANRTPTLPCGRGRHRPLRTAPATSDRGWEVGIMYRRITDNAQRDLAASSSANRHHYRRGCILPGNFIDIGSQGNGRRALPGTAMR